MQYDPRDTQGQAASGTRRSAPVSRMSRNDDGRSARSPMSREALPRASQDRGYAPSAYDPRPDPRTQREPRSRRMDEAPRGEPRSRRMDEPPRGEPRSRRMDEAPRGEPRSRRMPPADAAPGGDSRFSRMRYGGREQGAPVPEESHTTVRRLSDHGPTARYTQDRQAQNRPTRAIRKDGTLVIGGIKIKKRFFIFAALALVIVGLALAGVVSLIKSIFAGYYVVDYGMLESNNEVSALLLRNETVVRAEGYGSVEYVAKDNDTVIAGQSVLDFYSSGYTKDIQTELTQVNTRIEQQQASVLYPALKDIIDTTLDEYDNKIASKATQLREAIKSPAGTLLPIEEELQTLMMQKQSYLEQTTSAQTNTTLSQLYASRQQLLSRIEGWKSAYSAPENGRVSYYFDGFEPYLTMEVLDLLDPTSARELLRNNDPEQPDALRSQQVLYRIVNPVDWYTILLTNDTNWTIGVGESCVLYFHGFDDVSFTAQVQKITGSPDNLMVILHMTEDIGSLINARKLTAVIGGRVEGMRVPLSAVTQNGEQQGVYLYDTNEFVPVRVIGHDTASALVTSIEEGKIVKDTKIKKFA